MTHRPNPEELFAIDRMSRTEQDTQKVPTLMDSPNSGALAAWGYTGAGRERVLDDLESTRRRVRRIGLLRFLWWDFCNGWRDIPSNYR